MVYRRKRVRPARHGKGRPRHNSGNNAQGNHSKGGNGKGPNGHNKGGNTRGGHGRNKEFHVRVNPDSPFASLAGMFDKKK